MNVAHTYAQSVFIKTQCDAQVYNIGSQKERTVLDVAHDIAAIFSLPVSKIVHVRDRAFNDQRYYICDKRLAALGARDFGSACLLVFPGTG